MKFSAAGSVWPETAFDPNFAEEVLANRRYPPESVPFARVRWWLFPPRKEYYWQKAVQHEAAGIAHRSQLEATAVLEATRQSLEDQLRFDQRWGGAWRWEWSTTEASTWEWAGWSWAPGHGWTRGGGPGRGKGGGKGGGGKGGGKV